MAKHKLIETEENFRGEVIFYTNGPEFYANKSDILAFIEEHIQPTETTGVGLICDPYAREEDVCIDPAEYYQEHQEEVDNRYFKEVINK